MRLVIDMQGAQTASRDRGIGRYTLSLVRRLIQIAEHHEIILFINAALRDGSDALIAEFRRLVPREQIIVFEPMPSLSFQLLATVRACWQWSPYGRRCWLISSPTWCS